MSILEEMPREASIIKAKIVKDYYSMWLKIVPKSSRHTPYYIDLFCGNGRFRDGTKSTPILVLEEILKNANSNIPLFIFNDENKHYLEQLSSHIRQIDGYEQIKDNIFIANTAFDNNSNLENLFRI